MNKHKYRNYNQKNRGSKVIWIFFGIALFSLVLFPFFGQNWTYKIGSYVSQIFFTVGTVLIIGGPICMMFGILCLLSKDFKNAFKCMMIGMLCLFIATWLYFPGALSMFTSLGEAPLNKGYY
jgi:hypothetical protein